MANGKKILIIEDEKFLSLILKGRLEKEGFEVSQAMDGEEGLRMARENRPEIILLDLIMPKVSGFELLETMRTDPELSKIPVVVASNLGQESDIQKAKGLGVVDYYVKATTQVENIVKMVKRALGMPEDVQMEVSLAGQAEGTEVPQQPIEETQPIEQVREEVAPQEMPSQEPAPETQPVEPVQQEVPQEIPPQEPVQNPNQTPQ